MLANVIIANLNKHFTGVTATLHNVVPHQLNQVSLSVYGPSLNLGETAATPATLLKEGHNAPKDKPFRIWHARRNTDLWRGIFYRDLLRMPIRILFTSAAQRRHSALPRWLISKADAVIATTELAASFLDPVTAVIPHGINLSAFTPPDDKITAWQTLAAEKGWPAQTKYAIGQLGRIRPQKGTDLFVDALIQVLPAHPDAIGIITGTAMPKERKYKQRMVDKIARAGLTDRVIWTGQLPLEDLVRVQQALSLFVAAPRREEFGLTPAEALACGTPIICSDTGAFSMMALQGKTGDLIPLNDSTLLAQRMQHYLATPDIMTNMKPACRQHAEKVFSSQREAEAICQVYESMWAQ